MLKNKFKMIVTLFTIIALISSFAVIVRATDNEPVVTSDDSNVMPIDSDTEPTNPNARNEDETQNTENDEHNHTEDNNILYEDLYLFDNNVTMDKIVDGNVYIFGDKVKVTGKVNGNLFIFANEITFASPYDENDTEHSEENYSYVTGSIYACANKIEFNAIARDIYIACNDFNMSYESYILRDVRIAASNISLRGYITRDAHLYGNSFDFGTKNENEEENNSALICGDLHYYATSEISIPEGVVIGETSFTKFDNSDDVKTVGDYLMDLLSAIIYTLVIYLVFIWLAPKFFDNTSELLKTSSLPIFGIGTLILIVVPIVAFILLCLSLVSVSFTLATVYGLLLAISFTVVSGSLTYLLKDKLGFADKKLLLLLITTIVLWGLKQIPFVGVIFTLAISIFGLGLIIRKVCFKNKVSE